MEISPPRKMRQLFDFSRDEDLVAEFSIEKKGKGGSVRWIWFVRKLRRDTRKSWKEVPSFSAVQGKENVIKMRLEVREEGRRYEY